MFEDLLEKAAFDELNEEEKKKYDSLFMLHVELFDKNGNIIEVGFDHFLGAFETLEEAEFEAENSYIEGDWEKLEFIIYHPAEENENFFENEVKSITVKR